MQGENVSCGKVSPRQAQMLTTTESARPREREREREREKEREKEREREAEKHLETNQHTLIKCSSERVPDRIRFMRLWHGPVPAVSG